MISLYPRDLEKKPKGILSVAYCLQFGYEANDEKIGMGVDGVIIQGCGDK